METNRTTSRRALALIQIRALDATASSFARCWFSLSRLTPISRRYRVAPTERAQQVLLPWGYRLTVSRSLVRTSVPNNPVPVKGFVMGTGSTLPMPYTRNDVSSPGSIAGAFKSELPCKLNQR